LRLRRSRSRSAPAQPVGGLRGAGRGRAAGRRRRGARRRVPARRAALPALLRPRAHPRGLPALPRERRATAAVSDAVPSRLRAAEGRVLLAAARDAIEAAVLGREERRAAEEESSPALTRAGASFVTLRTAGGALRGCIGELEARRPLVESVRGCAVSAALRDPRFPPVTASELAELVVAISVLTPQQRVRGAGDVIVGRHGVVIERGSRRGVLLPEVAVEQGWDAATFVAHTCRKAGLPADAWLDPETRVSVF